MATYTMEFVPPEPGVLELCLHQSWQALSIEFMPKPSIDWCCVSGLGQPCNELTQIAKVARALCLGSNMEAGWSLCILNVSW